MEIPWHYNHEFRGQTTEWSGSDQHNKWQANMATGDCRKILEDQGWHVPNCITYTYNSHGFRDEEFDDRSCGIAMGCSFTQGIGVDKNSVWPRRLASMIGMHVWNLGVGGAALDTIFRLVDYYLQVLNPRLVFLLLPAQHRLEYAVSNTKFDVLLPNTLQSLEAGDFIKNWFAYDINSEWNRKKNFYAIMHKCTENKIPLYVLDSQENGNDFLGRDLLHPGKIYHDGIAKIFFKMLKNNY